MLPVSLAPRLDMNPPFKLSDKSAYKNFARGWTIFDQLTTTQRMELYSTTNNCLESKTAKKLLTEAIQTAFKNLTTDRKKAIGESIGQNTKWEIQRNSRECKGAYKNFVKLVLKCSKKEKNNQSLKEVEQIALNYLNDSKIPELPSELIQKIVQESRTLGMTLQFTSIFFRDCYRKYAINQISQGTNIKEIGFQSIKHLVNFLGPDCDQISKLCIPDSFILKRKEFTKESIDLYYEFHKSDQSHGEKIDPFFFEFSADKNEILAKFPNLKCITFQQSPGNEHCFVISLKGLKVEVDLNCFKLYKSLLLVTLDSNSNKLEGFKSSKFSLDNHFESETRNKIYKNLNYLNLSFICGEIPLGDKILIF